MSFEGFDLVVEISPGEDVEPWALAGAPLMLVLCATAAGFIPARRAASIEPMQALRTE